MQTRVTLGQKKEEESALTYATSITTELRILLLEPLCVYVCCTCCENAEMLSFPCCPCTDISTKTRRCCAQHPALGMEENKYLLQAFFCVSTHCPACYTVMSHTTRIHKTCFYSPLVVQSPKRPPRWTPTTIHGYCGVTRPSSEGFFLCHLRPQEDDLIDPERAHIPLL